MSQVPDIMYTLELNQNQQNAASKAVNLTLDLKDHKYRVIFPMLVGQTAEGYDTREKEAQDLLRSAFKYIYPSEEAVRDDDYEDFVWLKNELAKKAPDGLICLVMKTNQAHALNRAVDLFMRLKINQPKELIWHLMDLRDDDFCERRDCAEVYLDKAFRLIYPRWDCVVKDKEWHTLYNMHQVLRYAFYQNEHPSSKGVDSYPPNSYSGEPLPKLSYQISQ